MRHFSKLDEPAFFRAWKSQENEDWVPSYDKLQNPEKAWLHESLMTEQHSCCCYCGRPIMQAKSHIEHFRPQYPNGNYAHLALTYTNLHASCNGRPADPHCGHAKDNWFVEDQAISPMDPGCERRFRYELDGRIYPTQEMDESAAAMIACLRLGAAALELDRAQALTAVFDPDFIETATDEELRSFRRIYTTENGSPTESFAHVIVRYAEQLADGA